MKLSQLLEIQRCYALLRDAEITRLPLSDIDYVTCLRAQSVLHDEVQKSTQEIEIEVTA